MADTAGRSVTSVPGTARTETLREVVARAMLAQFEEDYSRFGETYNPDAVWAAADRVVAALASRLLGVEIEARHHPSIIGPAEFVMGEQSV